jgi:hypothetical protein
MTNRRGALVKSYLQRAPHKERAAAIPFPPEESLPPIILRLARTLE